MGEPAQVPDRDHSQEEGGRDQRHERRSGRRWSGTDGDNWWHSDRADAVGWGLAFIWGGLVLLASNTGFGDRYAWWDAWSAFFVGAGLISIALAVVRAAVTGQRQKPFTGLIFGLILLGIGLGNFVVWFWPAILLIIGLLILRGVFRPKKRRR